jgi:prophage tail gpP-like protein
MSRSPLDMVEVHAMGVPGNPTLLDFNFSDWTSFSIKSSIIAPAEASFALGDETGWERINALCGLGSEFCVVVNDRPRLVGRVEALSSPCDARSGTVQSFIVRTKMSDAIISSAPQGIRLKGASIKDFVLACYAGIGLREGDFDFGADTSRDLLTGKSNSRQPSHDLMSGKSSRGRRPPKALEPLKDDQAKVNPPESIFGAVDRHLRRHGMLHWDGPDGRIIVGTPDDQQEPMGALCCYRPPYGQANNILSIERVMDVSQSPTALGVFGIGAGKDFSQTKLASIVYNRDLIERGFRRTIIINDEAMKTRALAAGRANREYATRNRGLDRLSVTVDGLSYTDGSNLFPWAPDTVFEIAVDHLGGALGNYYVEDVQLNRNASQGDVSSIMLVKQGVWVL